MTHQEFVNKIGVESAKKLYALYDFAAENGLKVVAFRCIVKGEIFFPSVHGVCAAVGTVRNSSVRIIRTREKRISTG